MFWTTPPTQDSRAGARSLTERCQTSTVQSGMIDHLFWRFARYETMHFNREGPFGPGTGSGNAVLFPGLPGTFRNDYRDLVSGPREYEYILTIFSILDKFSPHTGHMAAASIWFAHLLVDAQRSAELASLKSLTVCLRCFTFSLFLFHAGNCGQIVDL